MFSHLWSLVYSLFSIHISFTIYLMKYKVKIKTFYSCQAYLFFSFMPVTFETVCMCIYTQYPTYEVLSESQCFYIWQPYLFSDMYTFNHTHITDIHMHKQYILYIKEYIHTYTSMFICGHAWVYVGKFVICIYKIMLPSWGYILIWKYIMPPTDTSR